MSKTLTTVATPLAEADEPATRSELARLPAALYHAIECEALLQARIEDVDRAIRQSTVRQRHIDDLHDAFVDANRLAYGTSEPPPSDAINRAAAPATRAEIAQSVARLLSGFPGAAAKLEASFVQLLAEHLADAQPSAGALQMGLRKLQRTWTPEYGRFCPSISEAIDAVKEAESEERPRAAKKALDALPALIDAAIARSQKARALLEAPPPPDSFPGSTKPIDAKPTVAMDLISETDDEIDF